MRATVTRDFRGATVTVEIQERTLQDVVRALEQVIRELRRRDHLTCAYGGECVNYQPASFLPKGASDD